MNTLPANSAFSAPSEPALPRPAAPAPSDERWFREEVAPHEASLRAWLRQQYPFLPDLDDIVQESYMRLLKARAVRKIDKVKPYLYGIARHIALEAYKKSRHQQHISVNELEEFSRYKDTTDVVDSANRHSEIALVIETLKALPDRCRAVVELRALYGLSYAEIAAQLGLAEETVRVQMARGIKKCAQLIRAKGADGRSDTPSAPLPFAP